VTAPASEFRDEEVRELEKIRQNFGRNGMDLFPELAWVLAGGRSLLLGLRQW
jgi:hypothetical protein